MKHVFRKYNSGIEVREDQFHPFLPEEWNQHTSTRPTGYSPAAIELMGFKKGIKREIAAYPSLRDETYFDGFTRSLFIVPRPTNAVRSWIPTILQVVNLKKRAF